MKNSYWRKFRVTMGRFHVDCRGAVIKACRKVGILSLLVGLGLFVYMVQKVGLGNLGTNLRTFGVWFLLIIGISGLRQLLRTWAWYFSIEAEARKISMLDLFNIKLIGDTITDLTFAGPFLGEPAKAMVASSRLPTADCLSSIVIENLIFSVSVVIFITTGFAAVLWHVAIPAEMKMAGLLAAVILILPALSAYLAILRRWLLLSFLADWARSRWPHWTHWPKTIEKIKQFEQSVYSFSSRHAGLFLFILCLELLTHLAGVAEAWLVLKVTLGKAHFLNCLLIESAYRMVNIFFAFVPLRLGVDESSMALALKVLGYGAGAGVTLAIIRKIRFFFWMGLGLLLMTRYTLKTKGR